MVVERSGSHLLIFMGMITTYLREVLFVGTRTPRDI